MGYILLTEDDALLVRLYQEKFKRDGIEVRVAGDGEEALKIVHEECPDLLLLDIMMPKMNGLEVLKKLKAKASTKHIPVIMLSNLSDSKYPLQALELGAVDYMIKVDNPPDVIVAKTKEILAASTRGRDVPKAVSV
ncbi:MAG: response regulator [bacterium]|nr:response regulator [bacterium]